MSRTLAKTLVTLAGLALFAAAALICDILSLEAKNWPGWLYFLSAMALALPFALGWIHSHLRIRPSKETSPTRKAIKVIFGCTAFVVVGILDLRLGIIGDGKQEARLYIAGALMIASAFALPLLTTRVNGRVESRSSS